MSKSKLSVFDRFMGFVRKADNGCWDWMAARLPQGYGLFKVGGKMVRAHRMAWQLFHGPIPEGLTLDHLCGRPCCVCPAHLEPVTMKENLRRGNGIPARNARKTHCKYGHEFSAENTIIKAGHRQCRLCLVRRAKEYSKDPQRLAKQRLRRRMAAALRPPKPPRPQPTHCLHGHEFTPENTRVEQSGKRNCRICTSERGKRYYLSVKADPRKNEHMLARQRVIDRKRGKTRKADPRYRANANARQAAFRARKRALSRLTNDFLSFGLCDHQNLLPGAKAATG